MSSELALAEIGQIAMPVTNLERAVEFYRDKLRLKFLFQAPPGLAFFDCAGTRLLVEVPQETEFQKHGSVLYFRVRDIDEGYATLEARGVPFDGPPHVIHKTDKYELKMAFFRDPDGNVHAIMHERGTL
jgi:methylmalonyl-CoA/ethylmalonyl-CoA epimerase